VNARQSFVLGVIKMMPDTIKTQDRALSAEAVGKMLSLSRRQVFRLNSAGKIPRPIRVGCSPRWLESRLLEWLQVGTPDRKTFEAMQEAQR